MASTDWRIHYPLHAAAEAGDLAAVERLLEKPDARREKLIDSTDGLERSALHYAAGRGRLEVVDALLNKGARVDRTDLSMHTALHKAAAAGHTSIVRTLALALADTNAVAKGGVTPIMLAAKASHIECVQVTRVCMSMAGHVVLPCSTSKAGTCSRAAWANGGVEDLRRRGAACLRSQQWLAGSR